MTAITKKPVGGFASNQNVDNPARVNTFKGLGKIREEDAV